MTRGLIGVIGLLWVLSAPCAAETIQAESRITAVTVFLDRASVTRVANIELSEGAHTIEMAPLPSRVEPASVAAKGTGQADVTLYGVRLVTRQLETAQDPRVKELEESIRKAERDGQYLEKKKGMLEQERNYLGSIRAASGEQLGKDLVTKTPNASDAAALLAFLNEAFLENLDEDQSTGANLETTARTLDKLRRELSELTQGRYRQETAILVDVEVKQGGAFALQVSYRVPGATWQPTYEARAASGATTLELATSGLVRQQTGEDWTNVALTFSTAKPAIDASMPALQPWFLRPWEPVYAKRGGLVMQEAAAPAGDELRENALGLDKGRLEASLDQPAAVAYATVAIQGPTVTFVLPKPTSIPSDWQPHKVPVMAQQLTAAFSYQTTPRLAPYAFLQANVTNSTDALYLAGPVSVFLDGAFVGTGAMKQVAGGETFDLSLGVDERVKIERRQLKERIEVSLLPGLRGKTKSIDYEFLTTVENFTGRKITVTAFDQVPVSEREEIVVESVKSTPDAIEKDPEKPGVFRWIVELVPNQKQELRLSYRVRHPVDMQIQ